MQTKLKLHRNKLVIYYSYKKNVFRETTNIVVSKKDCNRVKKLLNKGSIPSDIETQIMPVLERKSYCDGILTHLLNKNRRTPSVNEFKRLLKQEPTDLSETKLIPLYVAHLNETKSRFEKGTNSIYSLKDYKSFLNLLKDYELEKELKLEYNDLNSEFVSNLFEFMRNKRVNTINKQYRTLGNLKGRTIKKRFDNFKFFTKWLDRKLKTKFTDEIREAISKFDLSKEELNPPVKKYALNKQALEALKYSVPKNENEQMAKDIFTVSCYTSLRFSDLITLCKRHLKFDRNRNLIDKKAVKTGVQMKIPLNDETYNLILNYNYNLDKLTNAMLNKSLKKLLSRSEYFQQDSEYYKEDGTLYKLHEIISCHSGRRTMISRLLNEFNVPPSRVMRISGHKSIKSLNQYICSDDLDLDMNLL